MSTGPERAILWARLFPHRPAARLLDGKPQPGDAEAMRSACVQGVMLGCLGAFNWSRWLDDHYPMSDA
jgi:hypothetical protein